MMIGRLNDMEPVEDWRSEEQAKQRRLDMLGKFSIALAAAAIVGVALYLTAGIANAEQPAHCETLYIEPVEIVCHYETQTCVSFPETGQVECWQK